MSTTPILKLLVCSIGNPAPYTNTLHSAGHLILTTLQTQNPQLFPPFTKSRDYGGGLLSSPSLTQSSSPITLWQSTSAMNNSGVGVIAAYKEFLKRNVSKGDGEEGLLVVVHDELELGLGEVRVKKGVASAKGHNGLKSVKARFEEAGRGKRMELGRWWRIGVGIGRPVSREPSDVAKYVLRPMVGSERKGIEGAVEEVWRELMGAELWDGEDKSRKR